MKADLRGGTLYCGDNAEIMRSFADSSFDLTVTSPPYDDMRKYTGESEWDWQQFEAVAAQIYRVTKDGGVVVWNVADKTKGGRKSCTSFRQVLHFVDLGFYLADTMVWEKAGSPLGSNRLYHSNYEFMFVLSKGPHSTFNPIKDRPNVVHGARTAPLSGIDASGKRRKGRRTIVSGEFGRRNNIWRIPQQQGSEHPAPFPLGLARDHILSWTDEGATVLDPFMGSGTVACAAIETGRQWCGIDVSSEYCALAYDRILAHNA